jgi:hypothetical protein
MRIGRFSQHLNCTLHGSQALSATRHPFAPHRNKFLEKKTFPLGPYIEPPSPNPYLRTRSCVTRDAKMGIGACRFFRYQFHGTANNHKPACRRRFRGLHTVPLPFARQLHTCPRVFAFASPRDQKSHPECRVPPVLGISGRYHCELLRRPRGPSRLREQIGHRSF